MHEIFYSVYQFKWNNFSILKQDILLPILHKNFQSLLFLNSKREHVKWHHDKYRIVCANNLFWVSGSSFSLWIHSNRDEDIRTKLLIISDTFSISLAARACVCVYVFVLIFLYYFQWKKKKKKSTISLDSTFAQWYYAIQWVTNWLLCKVISCLEDTISHGLDAWIFPEYIL